MNEAVLGVIGIIVVIGGLALLIWILSKCSWIPSGIMGPSFDPEDLEEEESEND